MTAQIRFGVWWRMLRPFTLVASVAPVLGGTALWRTRMAAFTPAASWPSCWRRC